MKTEKEDREGLAATLARMTERQEEYLSRFVARSVFDDWPWDNETEAKEKDDEQVK